VAHEPVSVVYPPGYQASFEGAFTRAYESVIFGATSTRDAARAFITEVDSLLATT
jgi:multiple sugar transport system substrate-binding protein